MNDTLKMVITLTVITAVAAAALAYGNFVTRDKIKAQAKAKAARAVRQIFPSCQNPVEKKVITPKGKKTSVFLCKGGKKAFVFSSKSAPGISSPYGGTIKLMIGLDNKDIIKGVQVVQQSETPGLGAKLTEKVFLDQFNNLSLQKGGIAVEKDDPAGKIDAISGATITSRSVTSTVKAALLFNSKKLKNLTRTENKKTRKGKRIHRRSKRKNNHIDPSKFKYKKNIQNYKKIRKHIRKKILNTRKRMRRNKAEKDGKPVDIRKKQGGR
ncbi:MAG: RnfABCDGE type electron transport complex subunit G [Deltaproteobacteria bacterium]|jgi:electron transport complex protein RnfG|nr:RnfABCDGE type electron transport complex subunit G [Deltaproteobacteria bacterium]